MSTLYEKFKEDPVKIVLGLVIIVLALIVISKVIFYLFILGAVAFLIFLIYSEIKKIMNAIRK